MKKAKKEGNKVKISSTSDDASRDSAVVGSLPGDSKALVVPETDDLESVPNRAVIEDKGAPAARLENPASLPTRFIEALGSRLNGAISVPEKKHILVLLAHHGSLEAQQILKRFRLHAEPALRNWVDFAIDECTTFQVMYQGVNELEEGLVADFNDGDEEDDLVPF